MVSFGGAEQWELDLHTADSLMASPLKADVTPSRGSTTRLDGQSSWTHLLQSFATSLRAIINILEIRRLHPEAAGWMESLCLSTSDEKQK